MFDVQLDEIEKEIAPFTRGHAIELLTLYRILKKKGISLDELGTKIEQDKVALGKKLKADFAKTKRRSILCPECGTQMERYRISAPKGKQNRFGYTSLEYCPECGAENFKQ